MTPLAMAAPKPAGGASAPPAGPASPADTYAAEAFGAAKDGDLEGFKAALAAWHSAMHAEMGEDDD